jgi:omega-6 fatty acid desaturase (delta-12 desaturase)
MPEIRALAQSLATYREPDSTRGVLELAITAVPFLAIWALIWNALDHGYWLGLLLEVPAAGLLAGMARSSAAASSMTGSAEPSVS